MVSTNNIIDDPYAALRFRDYRLYAAGNLIANMGHQMMSIAVGWELYERTHSALVLGFVGLAEFLPLVIFALPAGNLADRYNRKVIVMTSQVLLAMSCLCLVALSHVQGALWLIYLTLASGGIFQAFNNPARSALLPQLIPNNVFTNAAIWSSSAFQIASVLGPAIGGFLIAFYHDAIWAYGVAAVFHLLFFTCLFFVTGKQQHHSKAAITLQSLSAGFHFVWQSKIILAALTLDMFVVLLGGVTILLPIFAKDILHVGPSGLGWLRAAPSIGALLMALIIAYRPPSKHVGRTLLWVVAGFGITMIVFGLSKWFWLSMLMLALSGALDNISVIIRFTLVQLGTPDNMRGRVSAVNSLFIGSSNELGGFESGVVAALFGPVLSAVFGGIGTILVVLGVAYLWPQLKRLNTFQEIDTNTSTA